MSSLLEFPCVHNLVLAKYMDQILLRVWRTITRAHCGYILEKENQLVISAANNINGLFNLTIIHQADDAAKQFAFIQEFAERYFHPSTRFYVLIPDYLGVDFEHPEICKLGYKPADLFLRMELADCAKSRVPQVPPGNAEIIRITRENYREWCTLMSAANRLPEEIASVPISENSSAYYGEPNAEESWIGFLVSIDGKFVATATSIALFQENCQYVFSVATHPDYRKRGLAVYLTWYVVDYVYKKTGISRSFLHSSYVGQGTYEKLGYRPNGASVMMSKSV
jgi:GNAT superfamily N-acetyltransferase